ncbi:MAG: c-type cytochrome [Flavobacteriales bacterium]
MKRIFAILICMPIFFMSCGNSPSKEDLKKALVEAEKDWKTNKGIGNVSDITLGKLDQTLVKEGEQLFKTKCLSCHRSTSKRLIGPGLSKVLDRRTPEWTMNMIMKPQKMTKEDPIGKALLSIYKSPMLDMNIKEKEARKILEYLRTI